MFISSRHRSIESTNCCSISCASFEKCGRELRAKPSRSIAYSGRSAESSSRFITQKAMPAANPCSITRGVFALSVFIESVSISSLQPTQSPIGTENLSKGTLMSEIKKVDRESSLDDEAVSTHLTISSFLPAPRGPPNVRSIAGRTRKTNCQ